MVDPPTLNLQPGQTQSYQLRLSQAPTGDGWWVRVFVDERGSNRRRLQRNPLGSVGGPGVQSEQLESMANGHDNGG